MYLLDEKLQILASYDQPAVGTFPASAFVVEVKRLTEKLLRYFYPNSTSESVENFMHYVIYADYLK
jgi:hypothetical protein